MYYGADHMVGIRRMSIWPYEQEAKCLLSSYGHMGKRNWTPSRRSGEVGGVLSGEYPVLNKQVLFFRVLAQVLPLTGVNQKWCR